MKKLSTKTLSNRSALKTALTLLLILSFTSCTMGKPLVLKHFVYELGTSAKLVVSSYKRTDKKMEFKLLGISYGAFPVVIKASEIECGASKTKFKKVRAQSNDKDLIILPKLSYIEFDVICSNKEDVDKDDIPYMIFKRLYKLKGSEQGEVIDSEVKIKFQ